MSNRLTSLPSALAPCTLPLSYLLYIRYWLHSSLVWSLRRSFREYSTHIWLLDSLDKFAAKRKALHEKLLMHSPPPTPRTRSNQHATRVTNVFQDPQAHVVTGLRKRNSEQAGLITPRETPKKIDLIKDGRILGVPAAKVLFPTTKRRKFEVFQDPSSPDAFSDDTKNPFAAPPTKSRTPSPPSSSPKLEPKPEQSRPSTPERQITAPLYLPDVVSQPRRRTRSMKRTPSPQRSDGMTYIFRGKRVFRKYRSAEEMELAASIKPKKLFVKEMNAPKLSGALGDDEDSLDPEGFDGLELSTYEESSRPARRIPGETPTARRLF